MLDIIALIFYARYLGRKTVAKGYSKGRGVGIAVGFWLGLEILFVVLGVLLVSSIDVDIEEGCSPFLALLFVAAGIGLAILISHLIIRGMPIQRDKVLSKIRSRDGTVDEQCAWVMELAALGSEILPQLLELYEREMQWPSSERFRAAVVKAIEKVGGREYLTRVNM